jgi:Flp pilus assembly protein TadG
MRQTMVKSEGGQTMTEFALVLPVFVVVLFAIIQFGIIFNNYVTLTDAARAASRKGAVSRNASDPKSTCESAGYAAGVNLKNPRTDFKLACDSSWLPGSELTVTASFPYHVSLMGWIVTSGRLNTTMKERVE